MCTIEDLKEMGIPLGPRKKIARFVKERVNKQVGVSLEYLLGSEAGRRRLTRLFVLVSCAAGSASGSASGSAGEESRGQSGGGASTGS